MTRPYRCLNLFLRYFVKPKQRPAQIVWQASWIAFIFPFGHSKVFQVWLDVVFKKGCIGYRLYAIGWEDMTEDFFSDGSRFHLRRVCKKKLFDGRFLDFLLSCHSLLLFRYLLEISGKSGKSGTNFTRTPLNTGFFRKSLCQNSGTNLARTPYFVPTKVQKTSIYRQKNQFEPQKQVLGSRKKI